MSLLRHALLAALLVFANAVDAQPKPQRVVSLDLCLDWMLTHYLPQQQVIALSPMPTLYPTDWFNPNWPQHDGSLEHIYSLKPDLVLVGQFAAGTLRERLKSLGVPVEVLPLPTTLQGIVEYQEQFLAAAGLPKTLASALPEASPKPAQAKRLLLLGANGVGTGTATLEHDILQHAGWDNYLTSPGYQTLDLERIVSDPPDAVLWAAPKNRALANRFAEHSALKKVIPAERWLHTDYWRWQCPGPWMWALIGQLNSWLD